MKWSSHGSVRCDAFILRGMKEDPPRCRVTMVLWTLFVHSPQRTRLPTIAGQRRNTITESTLIPDYFFVLFKDKCIHIAMFLFALSRSLYLQVAGK